MRFSSLFDTAVDPFKPENISEMVLLRLLKQDIIFHIKVKDKDIMKDDPAFVIYQQVGTRSGQSVYYAVVNSYLRDYISYVLN